MSTLEIILLQNKKTNKPYLVIIYITDPPSPFPNPARGRLFQAHTK